MSLRHKRYLYGDTCKTHVRTRGITLKPIGQASQKYAMHIYSSYVPCAASFIWMTSKLWKEFETKLSQRFWFSS